MAGLHAELKSLVTSATTAILNSKVFDSDEIAADNDTDGGGYDWANGQGLFTNGVTLVPHAIIRWNESNAYQAEHPKLRAERESVEIYIYQNLGYATIDAARVAIKGALHDALISTTDKQLAHVLYTFSSKELKAPEYQHKPMKFMRFSIIWR